MPEESLCEQSIPDWADMKGQNVTVGNVNADSKGNLEHLVWTIDRLPAGTIRKNVHSFDCCSKW